MGFAKEILIKAGLAKVPAGIPEKNPYDVFRDRLIFPLSDQNGEVVGFSGRALSPETEPKYLNSPDTALFTKSELLYGLDRAKNEIRKKNYSVLVEGQMDLVLSHQAGVSNTVASSGTAFTQAHLERLKRLSPRIILAFDGDAAGEKAGEKSTELALSLGLEVKIARLPEGVDPAELVKSDPEKWKEALRQAKPAIEHFLDRILEGEADRRKQGKLIEARLLPKVAILESSIERSHFVSLIAKRTGIKEEMLWDDLRRVKRVPVGQEKPMAELLEKEAEPRSRREVVEERLTEVRAWLAELQDATPNSDDERLLKREEAELMAHLSQFILRGELADLSVALARAEMNKADDEAERLTLRIQEVHKELRGLEDADAKVL
jgi:DNA primase